MTTYEVIITARNPFEYPINAEITQNTSSWNVSIPPRETKTLNYTIHPELGVETTIPPAYMEYFDFQHNVTVTFVSDPINFTATGIEIKGYLPCEISDYVKVNLSITNLVNITNGTFNLTLIGNETFEYNVTANIENISNLTVEFGPIDVPEGEYIGILSFDWDDEELTVDVRNMRKTRVGCYIGAYLGCGSSDLSCESIQEFNQKMGKPHEIFVRYVDIKDSYNHTHWEWAEEVKRNGAMPMFIYDPWDGLDAINMSDVEYFALKSKEFNKTVFIVFGHEMNLPFYPWGNDHANYTSKFKEVAEIFHRIAPNVEMCWVPNQNWGYPWGGTDYGDGYSEYYPEGIGTYGEYVDWVGLNFYEKDWDEDNLVPPDMFIANIRNGQDGIDFYKTFVVGKNKPMLIAETGAFDPNKDPTLPGERISLNETEQAEFKNEWIKQVYNVSTLKEEFPRLNAICYFHVNKTETVDTRSHSFYNIVADYRIPESPNVYKNLISDPYFIGAENQPPITSFTYSPENPVVNQTITFNASSSYDPDGKITAYEWDFGDGNITSTTEEVISHSYSESGSYKVTLTVKDDKGAMNSTTKIITVSGAIFDTGSSRNPYPSIMGTHKGTITPNKTIIATKLYTYACEGTGGHTEYARIWNETWEATATWEGYAGDWHNISFDKTVVLLAGETYFYEIRTGSYPQIHHTSALLTANGWINCTEFTDVNGRVYYDWIPAIKLF